MRALVLASFLLAGDFGYQQVAWSPPQIIFGEPRSQSAVILADWATTFGADQMAWSLSNAKMDGTHGADVVYGSPGLTNVVAERWPQQRP